MERAREKYEVSERHACRLLGQWRRTQRYAAIQRVDEDALTQDIITLAFNGKLRDECLNGEIFYSLKEAQIVIEKWRVEYNTRRPHSSLGYRPPAPAACSPWVSNSTSQPMAVI